jgi:hypothetical protein
MKKGGYKLEGCGPYSELYYRVKRPDDQDGEVILVEEINEKIDDIEISGGTGGSVTIDEEELNEMLEDLLS